MNNVLHLRTTRSEPAKRACSTCAHSRGFAGPLQACGATGQYTSYERRFGDNACGISGKLWELRPPHRGLITWLRDSLFAGWTK